MNNNMRVVFKDSTDLILLDVNMRKVDSKLYRIWYGDNRYVEYDMNTIDHVEKIYDDEYIKQIKEVIPSI